MIRRILEFIESLVTLACYTIYPYLSPTYRADQKIIKILKYVLWQNQVSTPNNHKSCRHHPMTFFFGSDAFNLSLNNFQAKTFRNTSIMVKTLHKTTSPPYLSLAGCWTYISHLKGSFPSSASFPKDLLWSFHHPSLQYTFGSPQRRPSSAGRARSSSCERWLTMRGDPQHSKEKQSLHTKQHTVAAGKKTCQHHRRVICNHYAICIYMLDSLRVKMIDISSQQVRCAFHINHGWITYYYYYYYYISVCYQLQELAAGGFNPFRPKNL